jgi:aspartate aminotransferase
MTGWRLGWALAPKNLISAMAKLQSQVTSGASSLSQAATEFAIRSGATQVEGFRKRFQERRDLVIRELRKVSGLSWLKPDGAFYVFVNFSKALKTPSATAFCERLLDEFGVCLIPGEAFGDARFGRLSYALSEADIKEGISRIAKALELPKS